MKNPNLPRFLTTFSVFVFKSHSKWFSLIARRLKNDLQAEKSTLNDFWKQKQKKLSKIWEDLDFWTFKIKIGWLYTVSWAYRRIAALCSITGRRCGRVVQTFVVFLFVFGLLFLAAATTFFASFFLLWLPPEWLFLFICFVLLVSLQKKK